MRTLKLIVKWTLIVGVLVLVDRACTHRDISQMPSAGVLLRSYSMYRPSTIKRACQRLDSLYASTLLTTETDNTDATAVADTSQAVTSRNSLLHRIDRMGPLLRQMPADEGMALVVPPAIIILLLVMLAGYVKLRRSRTSVRLTRGAKGMSGERRNAQ